MPNSEEGPSAIFTKSVGSCLLDHEAITRPLEHATDVEARQAAVFAGAFARQTDLDRVGAARPGDRTWDVYRRTSF